MQSGTNNVYVFKAFPKFVATVGSYSKICLVADRCNSGGGATHSYFSFYIILIPEVCHIFLYHRFYTIFKHIRDCETILFFFTSNTRNIRRRHVWQSE